MVDNSAFQAEKSFEVDSNRQPSTRQSDAKPGDEVSGISLCSHEAEDTSSDSHNLAVEDISFHMTRNGYGNGTEKSGEGNCVNTKGSGSQERVVPREPTENNGSILGGNSNGERDAVAAGSDPTDGGVTESPDENDGYATDKKIADSSKAAKSADSKTKSSSRRRKFILIMCSIAMFLTSCTISLIGPFYPLVAEAKGMSLALVGVVFGVFQFVIFLTSPLFAIFLTKLGPKNVFVTGILVGGVGNVLFGLLDRCPNGVPFVSITIASRCVQALGYSAFNTAGFAIVSDTYPNSIGTAFGVLQTGSGIGFMLGPIMGGALYQAGGYGLPFYVVGAMVLLNGLLVFKVIPPIAYTPTEKKGSMLGLLRSPMVVVPMGSVVVGVLGITTYDATFATRMEPFGLSTILVSLFFMVVSVVFSVCSSVWGYISDKRDLQSPLIVGGHLVSAIGFLLLGPSELLPFVPSSLWTIGVALACIGMSFGCSLIPTMKCMVVGALELNYEDNLGTYALVSGLYNSAFCLGGVVGPIASAALIDEFGHRVGYTAVGLVCVAMMLVSLVFFSGRNATRKRRFQLDHQNRVV